MRDAAGNGRGDARTRLGLLRQLFGERRPAPPAPAPPAADDPLAAATLLALQRLAIRPTPEAYTLWYRHLAGERPDLSRRLKDLEARGERFDAVLIAELFERYVGVEREVLAVAEASRSIERLLATLGDELATVAAEAAARGARIEQLGTVLGPATDDATTALPASAGATGGRPFLQAVRRAIAELVREVGAMRRSAGRLQRRVIQSAGEIAQLRATLEAAGLAADCCRVTGVATTKQLQRALRHAIMEADSRAPAAPGGTTTTGPGCCLLVVDPDAFAAFNKAHGRRLGDLALKTIARRLAMAIKRGDTIGRLDGAVFGIVLARTDLAAGEALAERLCRLAAEPLLDHVAIPVELAPAAVLQPVTVSIGIAAYHPGEPMQRLVGRADRARRLAKQSGGNCAASERALQVVGRPKA